LRREPAGADPPASLVSISFSAAVISQPPPPAERTFRAPGAGLIIARFRLPAEPFGARAAPSPRTATRFGTVKPPLTQMAYSSGRTARCVSPDAVGSARFARHPRHPGPPPPMPPTPSTTLLSAQEARERLREIVEGFFFRRLTSEDGNRIRRLLGKSPSGLGKTREAIDWAIRYQEGKDGRRFAQARLGDTADAGARSRSSSIHRRRRARNKGRRNSRRSPTPRR
jgi:hypothetical protein